MRCNLEPIIFWRFLRRLVTIEHLSGATGSLGGCALIANQRDDSGCDIDANVDDPVN